MRKIERINITVTGEAKENLIDYQKAKNFMEQGEALDEILLHPASLVKFLEAKK